MAKPAALGKGYSGKGVGALLQIRNDSGKSALKSQTYEVIDIEMSEISVNPLQPRKEFDQVRLLELKDSIIRY
jgi:hypothetical protein